MTSPSSGRSGGSGTSQASTLTKKRMAGIQEMRHFAPLCATVPSQRHIRIHQQWHNLEAKDAAVRAALDIRERPVA